jgi:hypothetical protein
MLLAFFFFKMDKISYNIIQGLNCSLSCQATAYMLPRDQIYDPLTLPVGSGWALSQSWYVCDQVWHLLTSRGQGIDLGYPAVLGSLPASLCHSKSHHQLQLLQATPNEGAHTVPRLNSLSFVLSHYIYQSVGFRKWKDGDRRITVRWQPYMNIIPGNFPVKDMNNLHNAPRGFYFLRRFNAHIR